MPPILSIIGYSDLGKTTLLEGISTEIKQRGYRTVAVKHARETFEIDKKDRSSEPLGQAEAVSSPREFAAVRKTDHDLTPGEISRYIEDDCDLILAEGFKQGSTMKIEVCKKGDGGQLLAHPEEPLALVSDENLDVEKPQLKRDDIHGLTDFIKKWLAGQPGEAVDLYINGVSIPLNQFASDIIDRTLAGMTSSLKGVNEIYSLRVAPRRKV